MKVKRHLLALAATAALVGAGSSQAVACGDSCAPNVATQSSSNSQILPISLGLGAAVPVNANVPVSVLSAGPSQGPVRQEGRANASGAATNNGTAQSVRQQGTGGGNSASQSASNSQILPIAAAIGAAVPVNANVPVGVLSSGPAQGVVSQRANANGGAEALNNDTDQSIEQRGDHGKGNSASQSSSSSQILPIALGLGAAVPVNANVPVSVLSAGPRQGNVSQRADADANGEALNNETEQTIRQESRKGDGGNSASQSSSNSQILPIALGAALAIPVNANVPIAILSSGRAQGAVNQHSDGNARARGVNVEHDQDIRQRGGKGANSATQSASNSQILPIALGAALAIPVNANVPIAILSSGPVQGDVNQRGDADATAEALNNETEQTIRQDGKGGANQATQSASNSQILPIALGAALAIPINLNLPISILSTGPAQGAVAQKGDADATAEAINYELDQSAEQGEDQKAEQGRSSGSKSSGSGSAEQSAGGGPAAEAPVNAAAPLGLLSGLPLPLGIVNKLLSTVQATLADPFGTVAAVLKDPVGSITGLLSSL